MLSDYYAHRSTFDFDQEATVESVIAGRQDKVFQNIASKLIYKILQLSDVSMEPLQ